MKVVGQARTALGTPSLRRLALFAAFWMALLSSPQGSPAADTEPEVVPAKFKISGYGLFGNRELRRLITSLDLGGKTPEFFTPAFVEDASMIIAARLRRDGYLRPVVRLHLQLANENVIRTTGDELLLNPLPAGLQIKRAEFGIEKGVLFYFQSLRFEHLNTVSTRRARSYFYETDALFKTKRARVFTPDRLKRGLLSLGTVLDRQGYRDAKAIATSVTTNLTTGGVRVLVSVQEGPRYRVRSIREEIFRGADPNATPDLIRARFPQVPYSDEWVERLTLSVKTNEFRLGYPDTSVAVIEEHREPGPEWVDVDLLAQVHSGSKVRINEVRFEGERRTSTTMMRRRVKVEKGELLDPLDVEAGRNRLARLGIFQRVTSRTEPVDDGLRDVIYDVREGRLLNVNLLFGYGSYELLRGGAELELFNLWGLAHNARLKGVQSFKSTSGEFLYNIPQVLGRDIDLFFHANGLRREEVSFTREEFGGGMGVHRYFQEISSDVSLRYSYQVLNAAHLFPAISSEGLPNPAVGAVILDFRHDTRDNPLYPREGYKVFSSFETGTSALGGDANYQRVDLSPSGHLKLGGGRYLSIGVSHGSAISFGDVAENLPFNRRYFPGGANSIRGYPEGEASPRNAQDKFVGAETYTLLTVEFEQALTRAWSVVFFSDSLGQSRRLDDFPWEEGLFSVGGGIRWRTIVGPVRAEYGYNLRRREGDPTGAFHFSIGYPF
jgi:outer membrane protein assembly complex protein YaeT